MNKAEAVPRLQLHPDPEPTLVQHQAAMGSGGDISRLEDHLVSPTIHKEQNSGKLGGVVGWLGGMQPRYPS